MKNKILIVFAFIFLLLVFFAGCDASPVKYKLQFVVDDAIYYTIDTAGSEIISLPNDPTKENFDFDGWYWDNNIWHDAFTVSSLLNQPLSSDMKVYAKWRAVEDVVGIEANFSTFAQVDDSTYSTKVDNNISTLNFSNIVEVNSNSTWTLNTDIYAQNPIPSKIATLEIGDNTYYVLVTAKSGDVKLYTLNIRRLPMYDVTYSNSLGTTYRTIQVQEESYVNSITLDDIRGYTFDSWQYDFTQPIISNTNIVAKFNANQYKIIYHSNYGDDEIVEQDVFYDQIINFKSNNTFTRNGYSLTKWNSNLEISETQLSFSPNARYQYNLIENLEVYAEWSIISYSIHYYLYYSFVDYMLYANVTNPNNILQYTVETETFELLAPTSIGSTFLGWFTDYTNGNKIETIETGSTGNLTLYAKWEITTFNITYHLDGGINSENNPLTYTYFTDTITLQNPIRTGYNFAGWYDNDDFKNKITKISKGTCGNIELFAKWEAITYTIIYNLYNGNNNENNVYSYTIESEDISLYDATKIGYNFIGWYSEDTFDNKVETISKGSYGDISLFAKFTPITYSITYYLDGGENKGNNPDSYTVEDETIILENPTKVGYVFAGWHSDENFKNIIMQIDNGSYQNYDIYAKWAIASTGFTFDGSSITGYNGSDTDIVLPEYNNGEKITKIAEKAFYNNTKITSVIISQYITSIGDYAFYNVSNQGSLKSVIIPNSVTDIGKRVFGGCRSLTSITIPNSIEVIGDAAFYSCYALAEVYNLSSLSITAGSSDFGYVGYYAKVVHTSSSEPSRIKIENNIAYYIYNNEKIAIGLMDRTLTNITLSDDCATINQYAFYYCSSLISITIPSSVTSIGWAAFSMCMNLKNVIFEDNSKLTKIDTFAFDYCSSLTSIVIPRGVISIGSHAFASCSNLTSITIPSSVTSIDTYAFYNCSSLASITIPSSVTSIDTDAFYNCSSLTSVIFENTNGWIVYRFNYIGTTSLSSTTLSNPSTAAVYLTTTYYAYTWTRS